MTPQELEREFRDEAVARYEDMRRKEREFAQLVAHLPTEESLPYRRAAAAHTAKAFDAMRAVGRDFNPGVNRKERRAARSLARREAK